MDLNQLQQTLRVFATQRNWGPFHTPKNLAMALMVEAAELAEIFQWMTPAQSMTAHRDPTLHEKIADEVADVLLYLLQLADHSAIDVPRAVLRKMLKNARKHPVSLTQKSTHVLLDWHTVQPSEPALQQLAPATASLRILHGQHPPSFAARFPSFSHRQLLQALPAADPAARDFYLAFHLGDIAIQHPMAHVLLLSADEHFDELLEHASTLGLTSTRVASIDPGATPTRAGFGSRFGSAKHQS